MTLGLKHPPPTTCSRSQGRSARGSRTRMVSLLIASLLTRPLLVFIVVSIVQGGLVPHAALGLGQPPPTTCASWSADSERSASARSVSFSSRSFRGSDLFRMPSRPAREGPAFSRCGREGPNARYGALARFAHAHRVIGWQLAQPFTSRSPRRGWK